MGQKSILAVVMDLVIEAVTVFAGLCAASFGLHDHDARWLYTSLAATFAVSTMLTYRFFAGEVGMVSEGNAASDVVSTWRPITPVHFLADFGWLYLALLAWRKSASDAGWLSTAIGIVAVAGPLLIIRLVFLVRWLRGRRPKPDFSVEFWSLRTLALSTVLVVAGVAIVGLGYHKYPAGFKGHPTPAWVNKPLVWVMRDGGRHRAAVLEEKGDQIKVHYPAYSREDEWIPRSRIVK